MSLNTTALWIGVPLMLGGLLAWNIAATLCKAWLKANGQAAAVSSTLDSFFLGTLFSSIGPVRTYAATRRSRGEPSTMASVFWAGLGISWGGFFVFVLIHLVIGSR